MKRGTKQILQDNPELYLAVVHWLDAVGEDEVETPYIKQGGARVITVGLVKEYNKKGITLMREMFEDISMRSYITIPAGMIKTVLLWPMGNKRSYFDGTDNEQADTKGDASTDDAELLEDI